MPTSNGTGDTIRADELTTLSYRGQVTRWPIMRIRDATRVDGSNDNDDTLQLILNRFANVTEDDGPTRERLTDEVVLSIIGNMIAPYDESRRLKVHTIFRDDQSLVSAMNDRLENSLRSRTVRRMSPHITTHGVTGNVTFKLANQMEFDRAVSVKWEPVCGGEDEEAEALTEYVQRS